MSTGFVDLHSHVLYGLDDGPRTLDGSIALLRAMVADGNHTVVCTPHIQPGYAPFDREVMEQRKATLAHAAAQEGLQVRLLLGAEITYTPDTPRFLVDGLLPTLAGSRMVLVEFTPDIAFLALERALHTVCEAGYTPLIAHIERLSCLQNLPSRVKSLRQSLPVRLQVNCQAVLQPAGWFSSRYGLWAMLKDQLIDCVATDAHNLTTRSPKMCACYQLLQTRLGESMAQALTEGNQAQWIAPRKRR